MWWNTRSKMSLWLKELVSKVFFLLVTFMIFFRYIIHTLICTRLQRLKHFCFTEQLSILTPLTIVKPWRKILVFASCTWKKRDINNYKKQLSNFNNSYYHYAQTNHTVGPGYDIKLHALITWMVLPISANIKK